MDNASLKSIYEKLYGDDAHSHYTKFKYKIWEEMYDAIFKEVDWTGKSILDVGSGTGEFTYMLANTGAANVLGIDYAENAVIEAKKRHNYHNLEYQNVNLFDVDGSFDVIVSLGTVEHMDNPLDDLQKMKSLLNENGTILVTVPNWMNPRGYILLTLLFLFDAKITLADLHHLSPVHFQQWAKSLDMTLDWKTLCHEWGSGDLCISDLKERLPKISQSSGPNMDDEHIANLLQWLEEYAHPLLTEPTELSGAISLFKLQKH